METKTDTESLHTLLTYGLNTYTKQINKKNLARLTKLVESELDWNVQVPELPTFTKQQDSKLRIIYFLNAKIKAHSTKINQLIRLYRTYQRDYSDSQTEYDKQMLMLDFSQKLGFNEKHLALDKKAFDRYFGHDAVVERYNKRLLILEKDVKYFLERLISLQADFLMNINNREDTEHFWEISKIEEILFLVHNHDDGSNLLTRKTFASLVTLVKTIPAQFLEGLFSSSLKGLILKTALDPKQETWTVTSALEIAIQAFPDDFENLINFHNLPRTDETEVDHIFIRRRLIKYMSKYMYRFPAWVQHYQTFAGDPKPFVRQGVAKHLHFINSLQDFSHLLQVLYFDEKEPSVRAQMSLTILNISSKSKIFYRNINFLIDMISKEDDEYVSRVNLHVAVQIVKTLIEVEDEDSSKLILKIKGSLITVREIHSSLAVRKWASWSLEKIWFQELSSKTKKTILCYTKTIDEIPPGRSKVINCNDFDSIEIEVLARALAITSQESWGLDIEILKMEKETPLKLKIHRGHKFGLGLWRFWHEIRNPRPDKRQAFSHTSNRKFLGEVRVRSGILAEVSQTMVPGEPLLDHGEQSYRPYLPLLDDSISIVAPFRKSKNTAIHCAEGVTSMSAPNNWVSRMKAYLHLSHHFYALSSLRNWSDKLSTPPNEYIKKLENLGFEIDFIEHKYNTNQKNDNVLKFFAFSFFQIPSGFSNLANEFYTYSYSIYRNSLWELGAFITLLFVYFIISHYRKSKEVIKYRESIPFIVGGWGSRGKSGTERLKAALFHGMELEVSSKTTGCEAMIVHSVPRSDMKEIFLFRPYDKATIWEQVHVLQISSALDAEVFLWECMALTPDYVRTLQKQWVKDDISTITNAHPDHEDVQGPAGINVAQVMCEFVPNQGHLITTEDQMRPILSSAAKENKTVFETVSFIDSGLITPDIIDRFPYAEHPFNIALVSRLANQVNVETDVSLKFMADFIVPDLGVLRQYPIAHAQKRKLQFINGMSANERFAALGNWQRMGMKSSTLDTEPDKWLSVVINNRADRVPRSQVFARICVEDIALDRIYLIGTNLNGFMSYLNEFWDTLRSNFSIWKNLENNQVSQEDLIVIANKLRVYHSEEQIKTRLSNFLNSYQIETPNDFKVLKEILNNNESAISSDDYALMCDEIKIYEEYQHAEKLIQKNSNSVKDELQKLIDSWFLRKIIIIHDQYAKANTITEKIVKTTPPGSLNRIMGMQNIKGTGLGFAYSWEDWGACYEACQNVRSLKLSKIEKGIAYLSGRKTFNFQSIELIESLIEWAKVETNETLSGFKEDINRLALIIKASIELESALENEVTRPEWQLKLIEIVEEILDPGDGIKRRKKSDQIYIDLCNERISHERAEQELKAIVNRQKGGWFKKDWGL